jgi:tetratricopeptide (TPR) repeat protein
MATATVGGSRTRAVTILEQNPGLVPIGASLAVMLWFAGDEGGFRPTTWMPATLLLLALLFVCLVALPRPRPSRLALAAVLLLTAYAAWSLLSILWAGQEELAWEGGNRTLLYALILALCTLWPVRGPTAAALLGAYGLGVAGIALVELLKAAAADQSVQYFFEARLAEPVGYANANVALWMLGLLPCAILAGRRGVPAPLRGLFLGSACMLAGAALMGQSRGWVIALPVTAVVAVVAVPGRGRTIAAFAAIGLGLLVALDPLLEVYNDWHPRQPLGSTYDTALRALLLASLALAVLGTLAALFERRVELPARTARRISAGAVLAVVAIGLFGVAGYAVVKGNPVSAVNEHWEDFKQGGVGPNAEESESRFGGSVSTYRYDYWEVAWNQFRDKPLVGAGADNFGRAYQLEGESNQTPRYPHSTVLVALSETGLIGAFLLLGAIAVAIVAAVPALRRADLAGAAAGAGVLMFAYWLAHGSLDWFWEFPGIAGPALIGLGVAMATARGLAAEPAREPALLASRWAFAAGVIGVLVIAASVVPPWLSVRELRRGTELAAANPDAALEHFDRAASLNPLSPLPDKAAGIIEIRRRNYPEAERALRAAFERDPEDSGLYLFLGVLASNRGQQSEALRMVNRARELAPTDDVAISVQKRLRDGETLDPAEVDTWVQVDVNYRISPE